MSVHPNVVLKLTVKPAGTTRKLARELLAQNRSEVPDDELPVILNNAGQPMARKDGAPLRESRDDDQIAIGARVYDVLVMESDYHEGRQIAAEEGDLVIFDLVTYGYGEEIAFPALVALEAELRAWATARQLEFATSVSANYW